MQSSRCLLLISPAFSADPPPASPSSAQAYSHSAFSPPSFSACAAATCNAALHPFPHNSSLKKGPVRLQSHSERFPDHRPHFRQSSGPPLLKGYHNILGLSSHCIVIVILTICEFHGARQNSSLSSLHFQLSAQFLAHSMCSINCLMLKLHSYHLSCK